MFIQQKEELPYLTDPSRASTAAASTRDAGRCFLIIFWILTSYNFQKVNKEQQQDNRSVRSKIWVEESTDGLYLPLHITPGSNGRRHKHQQIPNLNRSPLLVIQRCDVQFNQTTPYSQIV